jgi:hypothetical protein
MAPSCALDEPSLRAQLERYRLAGKGARLLERSRRRLLVQLADDLDTALVREAVMVERDCCPFFEIGWDERARQLSISVERAEQEPALSAIEFALSLETEWRC